MKESVVRIRIHPVLLKKYRMICLKNDLSLPKQTTELIRKFVEVDEINRKMTKHLSDDK